MRLCAIAAIAALTGLLTACSPDGDDAVGTAPRGTDAESLIQIGIPDTRFMGLLPVYVAEEQGMLAANGLALRWVDVRDPGQGAKLMAAGQADFMLSTFANLMPIEARKPGTLRFLFPASETGADPGSYVLVLPDSPIKALGDLRGYSLGTYTGPSQKAYALIVLERLGYRIPQDVRLVQVATSAQVQGLFGGAYDALFTVEPYASIALEHGARAVAAGVRTAVIADPFWLGSAVLPTELAHAQPTLVPKLLRALDDAVRYIAAHDAEARAILARRTGTDAAIAARSALYQWVAHPNNRQLEQIQTAVDLLHRREIIETPVAVRDVFAGIGSE